ncbi:hypothetical protein HYD_1060 [Candidatus Hydrogenosomobacter endosymbioticus]|uniref:Uncharacterized protein n=1 Tax=Candidatus Hydrogenosomobacter endosymbioticus TaxID=2558174 RepID=A0ABM7V906_9PROT|nr:hypothetical protein HYD_1060 [Candidatus Hydrogenosomobacter endosymbioticus]
MLTINTKHKADAKSLFFSPSPSRLKNPKLLVNEAYLNVLHAIKVELATIIPKVKNL